MEIRQRGAASAAPFFVLCCALPRAARGGLLDVGTVEILRASLSDAVRMTICSGWELADPATSQDYGRSGRRPTRNIGVWGTRGVWGGVEDWGLAGGNGAVGRIESDAGAGVGESLDCGEGGIVFVADFYESADRGRRNKRRTIRSLCHVWFGDGNPVYVFDFEGGGAEGVVIADGDAIVCGIDAENVERLGGGEAKALTLADGEIVNAIVAAEDFAGFIDDVAVAGAERNFIFGRVGVNELHVIAVGHKAKLHALWFIGDGQSGATGDFADLVLGKFAERKFAARELLLRKSPEKIGLVFAGIESAEKFVTAGRLVMSDTSVVAGGQAIGADLASHT